MVSGFDRIVVAVPSLAEASDAYSALLGMAPAPCFTGEEHRTALLPLANTTLQFVERPVATASIEGLVLRSENASEQPVSIANALDLTLSQCDGGATQLFREENPQAIPPGIGVDHVVLRTDHADTAITLFRDQLGIRLALDQEVPEWGGRMLFFRTGKLTLEVLASLPGENKVGQSRFWGITYQCENIDAFAAQLEQRGVTCSEVRSGRKPGTRVATVKSHCLGLPTLLIEHASR